MRALAALVAACLALALATGAAAAAAPDPMTRGAYAVTTVDPFVGGTVNLQEPNYQGGGATGSSAAVTLQVRGSMYFPSDRPTPAPVLVLVHGNHTQCDVGSSPFCTVFKRNDRGYAYLGANLASHGYAVVSLDQDQLMAFQDSRTSGMHQRRLLIAAALDMLTTANAAALPDGPNSNVGDRLVGKLDLTRVGLMGHSRGGDAVTSFINYNRTRPAPGRRYNLRGVIALAPVDYERSTPWGVPHLSIEPMCDGDVSNLQGARFFERGQHALPGDPFPRIQQGVLGGNHNWFNSVWFADGDDSTLADPACGPADATSIRLSGGTYDFTTRGDDDPELMGDQEKIGLATMSAFFRRYVGGEIAFDPYVTGELSAEGDGEQVPESACPTSVSGTRIPCSERVLTSYFPGAGERLDVITPEPDAPLTVSALGTALTASGFSNPYPLDGTVQPVPATTASGLDWCNPEPDHFTPGNIGLGALPTAEKGCPLPNVTALGGQSSTGALRSARENAPVNRSYGLQLAAAWDGPAQIATRIPAQLGDVSAYEALALGAAVNYFDPRNPERTAEALWNAAATTQDFEIALTDADGEEGSVAAGSHRYGNALHQTTGAVTPRVHVMLSQVRVPLADFAAQGVDLAKVRRLELRFGGPGMPATGSIELADVRFQEAAAGSQLLADGPAGGGSGGVQPIDLVEATPRKTVAEVGQAVSLVEAAAPAAATTCADTTAPVLLIASKRAGSSTVALRGSASDRGCATAAGTVASVQVKLGKGVGGGRFRYAKAGGTLTKPLGGAAASALVAKGTTSWSLRVGRLPKGAYRVTVTAFDAAGNARTAKASKLVVG